jgi:hypothetical protein
MIELLIFIAIIGLFAWALTQLVPMPPQIKTVIVVAAVLICLLLVLRAFGGAAITLPRID